MDEMNTIISNNKGFKADHYSPVPLYHQIFLHLRSLIITKVLKPEQMLPSEKELMDFYKVGRHTIRQALSALVNEGLVERFSGRGTFVKKPNTQQNFYIDRSFTQQMADLGMSTHSQVLEKFVGTINKNSPDIFRKYIGSKFLQLNRLRFSNDIPLGIQKSTILLDRCPDIDKHDFIRESLLRVLINNYQLEIGDVHHELSAGDIDGENCELLGIPPGSSALFELSITYLTDGEIIETTQACYRADKYRYKMIYRYRK
jgi:GntR family transcriptional regulator